MRRLLFIMLFGSILYSCDDGDIFEVTLAFDQELELCIDGDENSYLLYDTKTDPDESLTLLFPVNGNDDIFNPPNQNFEKTLPVNGSTTFFSYRTYSGDPAALICEIIPNPGTVILEDYFAVPGATAEFVSSFDDDDNDGILSEFEGRGEPAEDGTYPDAIDTDGDGIPNYIDQDDDNDNILTINENADPDGDGNPSDAVNTNFNAEEMDVNDMILPNYLDNDDDGDGTLTINEDENGNSQLTDDFDEEGELPNIPRYLNPDTSTSFEAGAMAANTYSRIVTISVMIINANIGIASITDIDMGTYTNTLTFPADQ